MIKRTPQEWADITGCYVARDKGRGRFTVYEEKPVLDPEQRWWSNPSGDYGELPHAAVPEEFYSLDWKTLYCPHPDNKSETNYQNQPEVDNKAPHQSEVYIGERYVFLIAYGAKELASKVERYLADGYSLYGSPGVKSGGLAANIYFQAMVRG